MELVHIENRANRAGGRLWWRVPAVLVIWAVLISPLVVTFVAVRTLRDYARDLPAVPRLAEWRQEIAQSSIIVAADGSPLAELPFTDGELIGHREWAAFNEIPPVLLKAVLAAEDVRFFAHAGIDPQAIARAALANYRAGEIVEGASTITQQLARNLLPEEIGNDRTARRKVREALVAREFERVFTKAEILEAYLNLVFLGAQSYGVKAAARRYFDVELGELSLAQAALIAGLAQAPGRADPTVDVAAARVRRDEVLGNMRATGMIDEGELAAASAEPIALRQPVRHYGTLSPWHTEKARQILEASDGERYRRGGLRVETTAEPALAIIAEERARARVAALKRGEDTPQVAVLVLDHTSGYVEAIVGGRSFAESVFDRALQACRQPGSAFKPILYGAALERDAITPGTALRDGPIAEWDEDLGVHWKPQNSGRTFRGVAIAEDAFASSLNAPAVDVLDRVGGAAVIDFARRLGITTKLVDVRPLALGSSCVIPSQLAVALAVVANRGGRVTPTLIKQIRLGELVIDDRSVARDPMISPSRRLDRIAAEVAAPATDSILDEETAFMLTQMMRAVVLRGTGTAARRVGRPAAGKTGTTNDNSDAWFVGFTGRVVATVWLGHDNPAIALPTGADGSHAALPLWIRVVRAAEDGRAAVAVPGLPPTGLASAQIDRETGLLAEPGAGGSLGLYFRRGTVPTTAAGTRPDLPSSLERQTREF